MTNITMTAEQTKQFNEWLKDGNVEPYQRNLFLTQCTQWKKTFTWSELKAYFYKEYLTN